MPPIPLTTGLMAIRTGYLNSKLVPSTPFARAATIGGQAFRRLIGGKVFVKGGVATR